MIWEGLDTVVKNLNAEISKIENGSLAGLLRATVIVRRSIDSETPMVPVDTGNLRSSWFVVSSKGNIEKGGSARFVDRPKNILEQLRTDHSTIIRSSITNAKGMIPKVIFGFSAFYAEYVHEAIGTNFKRPGSGAKYLEAAIKSNAMKILDMVRQEAAVRK